MAPSQVTLEGPCSGHNWLHRSLPSHQALGNQPPLLPESSSQGFSRWRPPTSARPPFPPPPLPSSEPHSRPGGQIWADGQQGADS